MIFTRTRRGLSNIKLFKRVDLIVFTEGGDGTSFSIEEAFEGKHHERASDIEFWRPLFERFRPDLSISFRALGTKNTLKKIAKDVAEGDIAGVCVVMDRDFDEFFTNMITHHRVVYTHKYSWESETFETGVISNAFQSVGPPDIEPLHLVSTIRPVIAQFRRELRQLILGDAILCAAGRPLFRRDGVQSSLQQRQKFTPPTLNRQSLCNQLKSKHSEIRGYRLLRPINRINIKKHCFGKLLLAAAIQTFHYLIELYDQPNLRNKYCTRFLIRGFHAWLEQKPG